MAKGKSRKNKASNNIPNRTNIIPKMRKKPTDKKAPEKGTLDDDSKDIELTQDKADNKLQYSSKKAHDKDSKNTPSIGEEKTDIDDEGGSDLTSFELNDKSKNQIKKILKPELAASVNDVKKDFIIIFGLFASFVTFISVNVQLFKNFDNIFQIVGACSLTLSFVLFFALAINNIVFKHNKWENYIHPTTILILIFLTFGTIFINIGANQNNKDYKKIVLENNSNQDSILNLKNQIKNLESEVNKKDSILSCKFTALENAHERLDTTLNQSMIDLLCKLRLKEESAKKDTAKQNRPPTQQP